MKRRILTRLHSKRLPLAVALVALLGAGAAYFWWPDEGGTVTYVTAPARIATVTETVSASGSLKPVNTVSVGTQVTGPVLKLYADYNDKVKKGQLLAEIDPTLQEAQIARTEAQIATLESALELAERNAARLKRLFESDYVSRSEWERADQDLRAAKNAFKVERAQLDSDRRNLEYAKVRSPVDGVVISREVNEGQTVQASFQTPTLFTIAEDLSRMQIELKLAEADVGNIHEGQEARFTVDTYPERSFTGVLSKLRLNPSMQQGSVAYTAMVNLDNRDFALLPGMTAYVNLVIQEKKDVLAVPNAALRYVPSTATEVPAGTNVYVLEGGRPRAVTVQTGVADNRITEITEGALKEGDAVILREMRAADDQNE